MALRAAECKVFRFPASGAAAGEGSQADQAAAQ